ncbi:hypothetical protein [Streptomyces flavofungini]|uniref:hypothetical protein n=1 Tax=Streptomyces flavofungini TaxID=68200 RepID=UPI0025B1F58B|nr:hypothetical protein [Streptomyces flavofungini]WJV47924.1 hypothetical protein QUY26_21865 [Streptomyces flavofungini]
MTEAHHDDPLADALRELAAAAERGTDPAPAPLVTARGERVRRRRFAVLAASAVLLCGGMGGAVAAGLAGSAERVPPADTSDPRPAPSSGDPVPDPTESSASSSSSSSPGPTETSEGPDTSTPPTAGSSAADPSHSPTYPRGTTPPTTGTQGATEAPYRGGRTSPPSTP